MNPSRSRGMRWLMLLCMCVLWNTAAAPGDLAAPVSAPPPVSSHAQKLYQLAKPYLLQVRTLTTAGRSQAGVGSGFVIAAQGLVVTNYHVVAKLALEPDRYVGETLNTAGERSEFTILALDVLNDLAVLKVQHAPEGHLNLHQDPASLGQGQRLYSLGNPLDLGFAISEGSFNGLMARPYYDQILFSGAINPGMSGGPALADDGTVVGVNVSKRLDGELISFLVPARFVKTVLDRAIALNQAGPIHPKSIQNTIGQQLEAHQSMMAQALLNQPFSTKMLGGYAVPVHESNGIRCWGRSPYLPTKPYRVNNLECRMESSIYVDDDLRTGFVNIRHEHIAATELPAIRFSTLYSNAFRNEYFGRIEDQQLTAPVCHEDFIRVEGDRAPSLRAVLCVRALRQFDTLYEFNLLTATLEDSRSGVQSRIDVSGVSYENGQRITQRFLNMLRKATQ